MREAICACGVGLFLVSAVVARLDARVVRVDIASRKPVLDGRAFGDSGVYERLTGRVHFSVAVANPHNRPIVDLQNAVNLKNGEVEFSADFVALRPVDEGKGNGSLILEVPNRGHGSIVKMVDGGDEDLSGDAGDGWLLRHGFTVVTLGWQWDAAGEDALRLYAPIAKENGRTITGLLRGDLMPSAVMQTIPLGHLTTGHIGGVEYPVAEANDPRNVLTVRNSRDAARVVIPRSEWQFAQELDGKLVPDQRHIHLNGGFQAGKLYEYVYVVKDPVVAGLGFAAVRDYADYSKHVSDAVTPAQRVFGQGISQDGRFLRDFLFEGFNADEAGRMALDGVLAHVAGAGRGSFNYRFAQPSRDAQPTSSVDFPTDVFPFTDRPETDPITGQKAGLLDRAVAERVVPKIFFSNTSYEYWGRAAALIHTSADGKRDVAISDNVRIYQFTGLQHFSGPFPPAEGVGDLHGGADVSRAGELFLAFHDREHGCVGPQRYGSAAKQVPEARGRHTGELAGICVSSDTRNHAGARSECRDAAGLWAGVAEKARTQRGATESGRCFSGAGAAGGCGWQRVERSATARDCVSSGYVCELESAFASDRSA